MEFRQLLYFVEVAKREHVTEAAHTLHVAQSAVSRQISNLEEELGVELFIREGRNVRITPAGRIFLEQAEIALKAIEKAKQEISDFLHPEKGTIRLGFPSSVASYTLPTVISAFREKYPHIHFHLRQGSNQQLIDYVIKGELDLSFIGSVPHDHKGIKGQIFFVENILGLLPANHPLANRFGIRLWELKDDPFILFPQGYELRNLVLRSCNQVGFQPHVPFEGEDIDAIKGLVAAGLGVSLLPEITLMDSIPRRTVKVNIVEPVVTRTVGMIIPDKRKLAPSEQLFYNFTFDYFNKLNKYQV